MSAAALLACVATLWHLTDGLRAWTSESARRLAVARQPVPVPTVELEDQYGRRFRLDQMHGRPVLVDFVYTHCKSSCVVLGYRFRKLQNEFSLRGTDTMLVSISIDPDRDTPPALMHYARHHRADGKRWRVSRVVDRGQLDALLKTFGVVAIPDGTGEFQHNVAIHVVDAGARLARILDFDSPTAEVTRAIAGL